MVSVPAPQALKSAELIAFHDQRLAACGGSLIPDVALWQAIEDNHHHNCMLWEQEDLARRRNVPDSEIAGNKRAIDGHNQKRNDAIERIDDLLLQQFDRVVRKRGAKQNSETAGAMIDRLSILSLKIHHMRLQTRRSDVDRAHIDACKAKLATLVEHRTDLAACLDRLLAECERGEAYFKIYRQFKMYNDPSLNPALYGKLKGG